MIEIRFFRILFATTTPSQMGLKRNMTYGCHATELNSLPTSWWGAMRIFRRPIEMGCEAK